MPRLLKSSCTVVFINVRLCAEKTDTNLPQVFLKKASETKGAIGEMFSSLVSVIFKEKKAFKRHSQ